MREPRRRHVTRRARYLGQYRMRGSKVPCCIRSSPASWNPFQTSLVPISAMECGLSAHAGMQETSSRIATDPGGTRYAAPPPDPGEQAPAAMHRSPSEGRRCPHSLPTATNRVPSALCSKGGITLNDQRFDTLTKSVMSRATRRQVVRFSAAGLTGAVVALLGREAPSRAAPNTCSVGCAGLPGPQKAACKQACRHCAGGFDSLCPKEGPFGPTEFTCCSEFLQCVPATGECVV